MPDSITNLSDSELANLASALVTTVTGTPGKYGVTTDALASLTGLSTEFTTELTDHNDAQNAAKAQRIAKDNKRSELEAIIREIRLLAKAAKIPDATYAEMGIQSSSNPSPSTATVPTLVVNTAERLRHKLEWTDQAAGGNKKKPRGTMGAEIWVKIDGPPPGSEKDCTFLTLDAFTPYVAEYEAEEGGKTAHYMIRWRMRDGSVSAWGETVSATITA